METIEQLINFRVETASNKITRLRLEEKTGIVNGLPEEGGACSTSAGGFRPWRLDNGTITLGY
jgi:hypothetical protein